jgi:methylated-DNA-[protein]-cysteine S-methyltransferase
MKKSFAEKCYDAIRKVPMGKVTTYKYVAHFIGSYAYRAVGTAMKNNPDPSIKVPCHRVVNSNGNVGGYVLGGKLKEEMLIREGVKIKNGKIVNFGDVLYRF